MTERKIERIIVLITALGIIAYIGAVIDCYQWEWAHLPFVRIIFHAVAALAWAMLLTTICVPWVVFARESMGKWICIINRPMDSKKRKKRVRFWRRTNNQFFLFIQPFIGTILYIIYAYRWETWQAVEYERKVQTGQLATDIIFSVIGGIIWVWFFWESIMPKWYEQSPRDNINIFLDEYRYYQELVEYYELSDKWYKIAHIFCWVRNYLIPVGVGISFVILVFIVVRSMENGLWIPNM